MQVGGYFDEIEEVEGEGAGLTGMPIGYGDAPMGQNGHDSGQIPSDSEGGGPVVLTDGTRFAVYFDDELEENNFEMKPRSATKGQTTMHIGLLGFLVGFQSLVIEHIPTQEMQIFTRHKRGSQIFRGHPNYRGKGPWKDWAIVDWGPGCGRLPCQISCFAGLALLDTNRKLEFGGVCLAPAAYAAAEGAEEEANDAEREMPDLFIPLLKDIKGINSDGEVTGRKYYLAGTDAFVEPCCAIPDIGGPPNRYFQLIPRPQWADVFIDWVRRSHGEGEMPDDEGEMPDDEASN